MSTMTHRRENTARRYPYEPLEESGYDEALDELSASEKDNVPHIPTFARRILSRLNEVGLLHTTDAEPPANVRKAKLDNEQDLWVRFDTYRDDEGYMAVDVVDAPRSDAAILAAMVAWVAQPLDSDQLFAAPRFFNSPATRAQEEKIQESLKRMKEGQDIGFEEWKATMEQIVAYKARIEALTPLQYLLPFIWYYKPEFEDYSPEEQHNLVEKTCVYINDFLESLRKLQAFLEYGTPNRKLTPTIKEPRWDVRATVLYDVDGLNYRQIGERMGIPVHPEQLKNKGEHQTVRKMVERGRRILEEAFGEEGWRERVEGMKAEKTSWQSLSAEEREKEREVERTALEYEIPIEEARRWVERRRS